MGEIGERYRRRADAFERTVAAVRPYQWDNPSPCAEWTARDVLDHVVEMHSVMLIPVARKLPAADDLLIAFQEARAAIEDVLDDPIAALTESDTPIGRVTAEQHIDQVVSDDLVLHGWDLARATGQDETIEPADVERLWAITVAIPPELMAKYRTPGAFGEGIEVYGAEVVVPPDAPLQDRLLGLLGREP
ncbi:maleylpyruvate isomerase family mycothiol-dependent enzyme [Kribbella hippodromi]|uniref:Maleylpyruvate isomerase family mycothiol-dependent enzyme n=1 Tax=Kribbella hippodromi TaxID=434347 RepID=A0ABN2E677_9ACTN